MREYTNILHKCIYIHTYIHTYTHIYTLHTYIHTYITYIISPYSSRYYVLLSAEQSQGNDSYVTMGARVSTWLGLRVLRRRVEEPVRRLRRILPKVALPQV